MVALRSKLLVALSGQAGMVSLACSADRTRELLLGFDGLSIAAINGRSAVVVSRASGQLDELVRQCEALEIRARRIDVDYASHSVQVEAIRDALLEALADIEPRSTRTSFISTVTGESMDTAGLNAEYWYRNIRQTVEFDRAIRSACKHGYRAFVEASPHPVLMAGVEDTAADCIEGADPIVVPSLGRDDGGWTASSPRSRRHTSPASRWRGARPAPAARCPTCPPTPSSDADSGCPAALPAPATPVASAWAAPPTRCSAPWSSADSDQIV